MNRIIVFALLAAASTGSVAQASDDGPTEDGPPQRWGLGVGAILQNSPYAGEGMRVQPEWLFNFLRDPPKNAIRPFLHPELVYGDGNVPGDKLQVRMPTFPFSSEQITAVVRYFAAWDGQEYPYQTAHTHVPSPDQKLYVASHMNSAQHANCISCHYVGEFPVHAPAVHPRKMEFADGVAFKRTTVPLA